MTRNQRNSTSSTCEENLSFPRGLRLQSCSGAPFLQQECQILHLLLRLRRLPIKVQPFEAILPGHRNTGVDEDLPPCRGAHHVTGRGVRGVCSPNGQKRHHGRIGVFG